MKRQHSICAGNKIPYFVLVIIAIGLISCSGEKKDYVSIPFDSETIPTMAVDSVTELISDSGIIRYKLITKTWLFFDKAKDPYWFFPNGMYVEQFDTMFHVQVTLRADTAWNYTNRRLWKLKGKVFVRNAQNETFESEELYWDERKDKVYSDKYIEINRPEKLMLRGYGFESDQRMTQYRIFRPHDSDIYVEEERIGTQDNNEISTDSISSVN